jgi:hypothetical protein
VPVKYPMRGIFAACSARATEPIKSVSSKHATILLNVEHCPALLLLTANRSRFDVI